MNGEVCTWSDRGMNYHCKRLKSGKLLYMSLNAMLYKMEGINVKVMSCEKEKVI